MGLLKSPPFWQLFLLDIYIRFCLKEGFCGKKRRRKKEGLEEKVGLGGDEAHQKGMRKTTLMTFRTC